MSVPTGRPGAGLPEPADGLEPLESLESLDSVDTIEPDAVTPTAPSPALDGSQVRGRQGGTRSSAAAGAPSPATGPATGPAGRAAHESGTDSVELPHAMVDSSSDMVPGLNARDAAAAKAHLAKLAAASGTASPAAGTPVSGGPGTASGNAPGNASGNAVGNASGVRARPSANNSAAAALRTGSGSGPVPGNPPGSPPSKVGKAAANDPLIGAQLGNHTIDGVIGKGGMGTVYHGRNVMLGREVAVKLLNKAYPPESEEFRRFIREAQAASRLNHPNCVALYEVGVHNGHNYIVMEFVPGGTSWDRVRKQGPIPWLEATRIIAEALKGVAAAHAARMMHRDIKPANILIAPDGTVKLADFGLAKSSDGGGGLSSLTGVGMVVGTPDYMSPEQCVADPMDHRTDIYAMGCTYYALLVGKTPYGHMGVPTKIMQGHCVSPVPDPRAAVADIPESVTAVIRRAMAKSPDDRYQSAAEMLGDLEAVMAGGGVSADVAGGGGPYHAYGNPGGGEGGFAGQGPQGAGFGAPGQAPGYGAAGYGAQGQGGAPQRRGKPAGGRNDAMLYVIVGLVTALVVLGIILLVTKK